jgi:hypothetical protein
VLQAALFLAPLDVGRPAIFDLDQASPQYEWQFFCHELVVAHCHLAGDRTNVTSTAELTAD